MVNKKWWNNFFSTRFSNFNFNKNEKNKKPRWSNEKKNRKM